MTNQALPPAFAALAPFVERWSVASQDERHRRRVASSLGELREFYDAIFPRMDDIIGHLNAHPLCDPEELPPGERNLYRLALSFMLISLPIDLRWKASDLTEGLAADRVSFVPA